ncbi:MAG: hypothetical protein Kow0092_26280 [Deferrisomatales bacterium]
MRYVAVGRVGRPHGVRGEVRVDPLGGLPRGLEGYSRFYLGRGEAIRPVEVEAHRPHGRWLLVKFAGVDTPEAARGLAHATLYVERDEMPPLEEGEYYYADVLGCRVVTEAGEDLGVVVDVFFTGGHDVLVVRAGHGREWMLPVVEAFVAAMDLAEGRIVTRGTEELRR